MKKILMVGPSLDSKGGISSVVSTYQSVGYFSHFNIEYIPSYADGPPLAKLFVFLKCFFWVAVGLFSRDVALVHIHTASRGSIFRKASLLWFVSLFGVPTVLHVHSGEFFNLYGADGVGRLKRWAVHATLKRADAIVVLAKFFRERLFDSVGKGLKKVFVLPNPVEHSHEAMFRHRPAGHRMRLLFLGGLTKKKGVFDLIRAVSLLKERGTDVELHCCGKGDLDRAEALCRELEISEQVVFPGWVCGSTKESEFEAADIFVLPSYFEGHPMVLLEAMASGLPSVATRVGGIPETLEDGEEGLLFEAGNIEGLVAALKSLCMDADKRRRFSNAAIKRVEQNFSAQTIQGELEYIYQALISVSR